MKKLLVALLSTAVFLAVIVAVFAIPIFITDTEYAPGYSESPFQAIRIGDSREDVLRALGEPLEARVTDPWESWLYCDAPHPGYAESGGVGGTFTQFTFDPDGRLTSVLAQKVTQTSMLGASSAVSVR